MQKLSACRNRASSTHFFSSTTTRCIRAICAAGPPKLMQPILSQTLKASPKVGFASALISRHLCRPIVSFVGGKAQPGEQCVIDHEAPFEQAVIVIAGKRRQAKRNRV